MKRTFLSAMLAVVLVLQCAVIAPAFAQTPEEGTKETQEVIVQEPDAALPEDTTQPAPSGTPEGTPPLPEETNPLPEAEPTPRAAAVDPNLDQWGGIIFADKALEQWLVGEGYCSAGPEGGPERIITPADMARVMTLDLYSDDVLVSDLTPLQYAVNLAEVIIGGGTMDDAAALEALPNLRRVTIVDTALDAIPAFAQAASLRDLNLRRNKISDLTPLAGMKSLNSLQLGGNQITDLSPLGGLSNLTVLGLEGNAGIRVDNSAAATAPEQGNYAALAGLKRLQTLNLGQVALSSLAVLDGCKGKLHTLSLEDTGLTDFAGLKDFKNLQILSLAGLDLSSAAAGVARDALPAQLWSLDVSGTKLTDLTLLERENLTHLYLRDNGITSLDFLLKLPNLEALDVAGNALNNVKCLDVLKKLDHLYYADLSRNQLNMGAYAQNALEALKKKGVSVVASGQVEDEDSPSLPTTPVGEAVLSAALLTPDVTTTRGSMVTVRATLSNIGTAPLEDFIFSVMLPKGIVSTSGAITMPVAALAPGESTELVFTFVVGDGYTPETVPLTSKVTKDAVDTELAYTVIQLISVTLNIPVRVSALPDAEGFLSYKLFGEATPGSVVEMIDVDKNERVAEAELKGKWYTANVKVDAQKGCVLVAKVTKGNASFESNPVVIEKQSTVISVQEAYVRYGGTLVKTNDKIGIPTFSAWTNINLIGRDFTPFIKFSGGETIAKVVFSFADKSVTAALDGSGYYTATLSGWSTTGVKLITATVEDASGKQHSFTIGQVTVLIDPSGQITDGETAQPIPGATVALEVQEENSWIMWDAAAYMQENPQRTDSDGRYGWYVPEGTYRLQLEKEGYESRTVETYTTRDGVSNTITILPVRTDVDVAMTRNPEVALPPTLDEVTERVKTAIAGLTIDQNTTADGILAAVEAAIAPPAPAALRARATGMSVYWSNLNGFAVVPPTAAAAGSVTGTLVIRDEASWEAAEVSIHQELPKLSGGSSGSTGDGGGSAAKPPEKPVAEIAQKPRLPLTLPVADMVAGASVYERFTDATGHWAAASIRTVTQHGLFNGIRAGCFQPDGAMSRAMAVTVLHRLAQQPAAPASAFADVPGDGWYASAVDWAAAQGIIQGSGGRFDPDAPVTREQLALLIFRYAKAAGLEPEAQSALDGYTDAAATSGWADTAMAWAVGTGILSGCPDGSLRPGQPATRAEVAATLCRFLDAVNPEKKADA